MGDKIELAEKGVEETAPFVIVGIGEFENDRNMGFYVNGLKDGDGRSRDGGNGGVGVGQAVEGGVGGGVAVGAVGIEERIEVHEEVGRNGGSGDGKAPASWPRRGRAVGSGMNLVS